MCCMLAAKHVPEFSDTEQWTTAATCTGSSRKFARRAAWRVPKKWRSVAQCTSLSFRPATGEREGVLIGDGGVGPEASQPHRCPPPASIFLPGSKEANGCQGTFNQRPTRGSAHKHHVKQKPMRQQTWRPLIATRSGVLDLAHLVEAPAMPLTWHQVARVASPSYAFIRHNFAALDFAK